MNDVDWESIARQTAVVGFWVARLCLGIACLVYAASFVGPPPAERADLDDGDAPNRLAHDAVYNLRADVYRVTVEASRTDETGATEPFVVATRTVDNRAHLYADRRRTGVAAANRSTPATRVYGTETTGYRRAGTARASDDPENASAESWTKREADRYHPLRNAFADVDALTDARATVVAETPDTSVVRIDDRSTVASLVDLPGHDRADETAWNATLTFTIDRERDRLARATYRYRVPETGERVDATYRFEYGRTVDVDRPLATYPPGGEVRTRLDLGLRTLESLPGGALP